MGGKEIVLSVLGVEVVDCLDRVKFEEYGAPVCKTECSYYWTWVVCGG